MAVTHERVRELALALDEASERPHFDRQAFRTPRKTFATLGEDGLNLMFDPDHQALFCEQEPAFFSVLPGGWGRMGCTRCHLDRVDETTLASALLAAHRLAAPKPKRGRH